MICTTVKSGVDCTFMTKSGCGYTGGFCLPVVEQCDGCQRTMDLPSGKYCASYPSPSSKWKAGHCNFATHVKIESQAQQAKVNPLKASKRASGKKK